VTFVFVVIQSWSIAYGTYVKSLFLTSISHNILYVFCTDQQQTYHIHMDKIKMHRHQQRIMHINYAITVPATSSHIVA